MQYSGLIFLVFKSTGNGAEFTKSLQRVFQSKDKAFVYAWKNSIESNMVLLEEGSSSSSSSSAVRMYFWGKDMHDEYSIVAWDMERNEEMSEVVIDHDIVFERMKFETKEIAKLLHKLLTDTAWPAELPEI